MMASDVPMHAHCIGHTEQTEQFVQHQHRNRTTADAEHAGEDAGRDSGDDDCERQPGEIPKRDRHAANDGNLEIGENDHSIICASFGAISRQPFQPQ